jgi:undecaprenyl-diphosphatase
MNALLIAILLGMVEGITEFLPVSSTGHLIISGHLLGFVGDPAASFEVIIQLGAILSVVLLYWRRFVGLIPHPISGFQASNLQGWSGIWRIALATFPALLVGYGARHIIKERLFNPTTVTLALAVGGIAILLVERYAAKRKANSLERLTLAQALGVGLFQVPRPLARYIARRSDHCRWDAARVRSKKRRGILVLDCCAGDGGSERLRAAQDAP